MKLFVTLGVFIHFFNILKLSYSIPIEGINKESFGEVSNVTKPFSLVHNCLQVSQSLTYYERQLDRYEYDEKNCSSFKYIGDYVMEKNKLSEKNCYKKIQKPICRLVYSDREIGTENEINGMNIIDEKKNEKKNEKQNECEKTKNFFLEMIKKCLKQKKENMEDSLIHCPSFDSKKKIIKDPELFCTSFFYRKKIQEYDFYQKKNFIYGSNSSVHNFLKTFSFKKKELNDCINISNNFNNCSVIGSVVFNDSIDSCLSPNDKEYSFSDKEYSFSDKEYSFSDKENSSSDKKYFIGRRNGINDGSNNNNDTYISIDNYNNENYSSSSSSSSNNNNNYSSSSSSSSSSNNNNNTHIEYCKTKIEKTNEMNYIYNCADIFLPYLLTFKNKTNSYNELCTDIKNYYFFLKKEKLLYSQKKSKLKEEIQNKKLFVQLCKSLESLFVDLNESMEMSYSDVTNFFDKYVKTEMMKKENMLNEEEEEEFKQKLYKLNDQIENIYTIIIINDIEYPSFDKKTKEQNIDSFNQIKIKINKINNIVKDISNSTEYLKKKIIKKNKKNLQFHRNSSDITNEKEKKIHHLNMETFLTLKEKYKKAKNVINQLAIKNQDSAISYYKSQELDYIEEIKKLQQLIDLHTDQIGLLIKKNIV